MHLRLSDVPRVVTIDEQALALAPRDAALLAWLAIEGPTPRAKLAALLWPNGSETQARAALRQRLFQLKKSLGADLATGTQVLELAAGVTHDLADARTVLGELTIADAPELDAWLHAQRELRRSDASNALRERMRALEGAGDLLGALALAERLLELAPHSESAYRQLMRLHYLAGDRSSALLAFDRCEHMLKHEVGTAPAAETLALLATIQEARNKQAVARIEVPAAVLRPPRMIGRARELAALHDAWNAGQVAAVIGEAGMGKSRLLQEFIDQDPGIVRAAGRPGDAGVPFATLARLLRQVNEHNAQSQSPLLDSATRREIARVLPEIGAAPDAGREDQRLALQRAVATFLASASRLTGLIVDDLHFADEASIEMLQALFDADPATDYEEGDQIPRPLRWIVAYRPAETGSLVQRVQDALTESARFVPVTVRPFDETAIAEFVDSLGLPEVSGARIAPQLLQRTGGNPLFVLETLRQAWVDHAFDGFANAEAAADLPRPVSVHRLIERRIAQLSAGALALARVASIAGVDFSIGMAETVLGVNSMQFADAYAELEAAQVLKGKQFAHDLVFETVLDSVPRAIAQHVHGKVAAWLEQHGGEAARIAEHWLAAEQPARAIPALKLAADAARTSLRMKEAAEFMLRAADAEEHLQLVSEAFASTAAVFDLDLWCVLEAPTTSLDRLDRLARNDRERAVAARWRAFLLTYEYRLKEALPIFAKSLALARADGDIDLIMNIENEYAINLALGGEPSAALRIFERIEAALEANRALRAPNGFHSYYAITFDKLGRVRDALPHHMTVLREEETDSIGRGHAVSNLAVSRFIAGDLSSVRAHCIECIRLYSAYDESGRAAIVPTVTLSMVERLFGRWRRAIELAERSMTLAGNVPASVHYAQLSLGDIWIDLGQIARANAVLREITLEGGAVRSHAVTALCEQARMRRWAGESSADCCERVRVLLGSDANPEHRMRVALEAAYWQSPVEALAAVDAVAAEADELGMVGTVANAWLVRATVLLGRDHAAAADAARKALARAAESGDPDVYRLEPALCAVKALLAHGASDEAHLRLREAIDWIRERIERGDVPAEFVDSFLHRNPINRQLLDLASTMRIAPALPC